MPYRIASAEVLPVYPNSPSKPMYTGVCSWTLLDMTPHGYSHTDSAKSHAFFTSSPSENISYGRHAHLHQMTSGG